MPAYTVTDAVCLCQRNGLSGTTVKRGNDLGVFHGPLLFYLGGATCPPYIYGWIMFAENGITQKTETTCTR